MKKNIQPKEISSWSRKGCSQMEYIWIILIEEEKAFDDLYKTKKRLEEIRHLEDKFLKKY